MKRSLVLIACVVMHSFGFAMAQEPAPATDSRQVIEALLRLDAIGREVPRSNLEVPDISSKKITETVHSIKSGQALAKLALACLALSSDFHVGDDPNCVIYDQAYWDCLEKAFAMKSDDGRKAVRMIFRHSDLQAGGLIRFNEITKSQE